MRPLHIRMNRTLIVLSLFASPAAATAQARLASNLVTHSEVTINRRAELVWPKVVDPNEWKQGLKIWHHAGPVGDVGEILAAGDPADRSKVAFLIENVEMVPHRRRTIKLYLENGKLLGYASWTLREGAGRTIVSYDVYSETLLEPAEAQSTTVEQLRAAEKAALATNQKRFDDELRGLKRLVETRRP